MLDLMTGVTHILFSIEQGDPAAAGQLLPLVHDELRPVDSQGLAHEQPGQTQQATAQVHDAYLRPVRAENRPQGDSRRGIFAARRSDANARPRTRACREVLS